MILKRSDSGFTLLELILAMVISSLVMGIISVALGFSVRLWERQFNRKTSDAPAMIGLLKWQLANLNPAPMTSDGQSKIIFAGQEHSITFATDHSVRAISHGVPVVVRYVFKPQEHRLYYAEIPFDPYHSEPMEQFMKAEPGRRDEGPKFQSMDMAQLSFTYTGGEGAGSSERQWNDEKDIPVAVGVRWSDGDAGTRVEVIQPNSFFPRDIEQTLGQPGAGKRLTQ